MPNETPNSGEQVITCAFCRGTGKDPFKILSALSSCQTCEGSGSIKVHVPYVHCGECEGTGVQPHKRLTCSACGGRGVQGVPPNNRACPDCGGTGADPKGLHLACTTCSGSGRIPLSVPSNSG